MDVPLVAGGLIADPQDELELQLYLRLDKIAGAEKIKNNNLKKPLFPLHCYLGESVCAANKLFRQC